MKTLFATVLVFVCATRAAEPPLPEPAERLAGWFNRTTLVDPQPSELSLADFYAGLEHSAWGESIFGTLFFMPNLVVDACGLVRTIAPKDMNVMDLGVVFFCTPSHKYKHWNTDLGIFDLTTTTLVARMGPGSAKVIWSSVYAWPTTEIPKFGWYWDWISWRDDKLQKWLGWPVKEEPPKWPQELDKVIELMGETGWCETGHRIRGDSSPSLLELIEKNPNGTFPLHNGGRSAASLSALQGLNSTAAPETHTEL